MEEEVTGDSPATVVVEPCLIDSVRLAKAMSIITFTTEAHWLTMLQTAQRIVDIYAALERQEGPVTKQ